jgi:hypothetical protein
LTNVYLNNNNNNNNNKNKNNKKKNNNNNNKNNNVKSKPLELFELAGKNKTEYHFRPYPRSRINLYTRLKIATQCLVKIAGHSASKSIQCSIPKALTLPKALTVPKALMLPRR